jgi:hypothetical protein
MLASLRPKRLAGAADAAVDYSAARRFRWTVVLTATLPLTVLVLVDHWRSGWFNPSWPLPLGDSISVLHLWGWEAVTLLMAGYTWAPMLPIAIALTLALATAAGSWRCRPTSLSVERQNRAVALAGYGCGPLAWLFLPIACIAGMKCIDAGMVGPQPALYHLLAVMAVVLAGGIIASWGWATERLIGRATDASRLRQFVSGFFLPAAWIFCDGAGLIVFPMIAGLVYVMVQSLR